MSTSGREAELAAALARVRQRIRSACASAGRAESEVTLVAVTKTWPASDIRLLAGLGVREVAESKEQEAHPKYDACSDLPLRWHFIGQLQRNKAAAVAGWADCVESVDREPLVDALAAAARVRESRRGPIDVLVQVDLREELITGDTSSASGTARRAAQPARGGACPDAVPRLVERVATTPGLVLRGLMAIAPLGSDPAPAFARLAALAGAVQSAYPDARVISAGMSGDLEQAITAGATHVRVGSALLGNRVPLR